MSFAEKLANVVNRHDEIQALLSSPDVSPDDLVRMNKEISELAPVVEAIHNYNRTENDLNDAKAMMEDDSLDKEMREMAAAEYYELKDKLPEMEKEIKILLLPKEEDDEKNAILEVRAGTGGDEAALFAAVLFEMYQRYSQKMGWKFEVLDADENSLGGYKEASAKITGKDVFAKLKFESGAHRVQRVPVTESQGRVHTSAATVAVLPEIEEVDMYINPADLKIDVYRASGAGGQHVNRTESAVRITHIPTGVVVQCQDDRSQYKNKEKAMNHLRAKLYDLQKSTIDKEYSERRKLQVGSGDRSERIRTYNYPQGRVTDHRINLTLYKLDEVVSGDALDEIIDGRSGTAFVRVGLKQHSPSIEGLCCLRASEVLRGLSWRLVFGAGF